MQLSLLILTLEKLLIKSLLPNILRDIFLENIACLEYLEKKEHRNFLYRYYSMILDREKLITN